MRGFLSSELKDYQRAVIISSGLRILILVLVGVAVRRNTPQGVFVVYTVGCFIYVGLDIFLDIYKNWLAMRVVVFQRERIPIHEPVGHRRKFALRDETDEQTIERKE